MLAVTFWVVCVLNRNSDTVAWLLICVSNVIESSIAQVDMVVTGTALILVTLTSVAGVVLRTSICHFHDNTSAIASAVATAVVLTLNLEMLTTHGLRASWALALAKVRVPAVIAVTSLAVRV